MLKGAIRGRVPLVTILVLAAFPAAAAKEATLELDRAACARLVEHRPSADVAYQAGIDVNGRAVAPADLDGGFQLALPETIRIPIEIDLLERFGLPADPALYGADAIIGEVTVAPDGRTSFNGRPIQDEARAELAARCQTVLRRTP